MKTLLETEINEQVIICRIEHSADMKRRLMDLGFVEKSVVCPVLKGPGGGMRAYLVKGCKIALRKEESASILVEEMGEREVV